MGCRPEDVECNECGEIKPPASAYGDHCECKPLMAAHGICWSCAYWRLECEKPRDTVIDGYTYHVGSRPKGGHGNGMGGRRFDIEYFDGRTVTTYDLWGGSEIPDRYRDRIPNTARFLGGAGAVKVGDTTCWQSSKVSP